MKSCSIMFYIHLIILTLLRPFVVIQILLSIVNWKLLLIKKNYYHIVMRNSDNNDDDNNENNDKDNGDNKNNNTTDSNNTDDNNKDNDNDEIAKEKYIQHLKIYRKQTFKIFDSFKVIVNPNFYNGKITILLAPPNNDINIDGNYDLSSYENGDINVKFEPENSYD
eukprot:jgi/Orpsp1_1/1176153/evm.model.c7180000056578.1